MAEILKYRENAQSPWQDIVALVGPAGKDGANGADGKDFTYDMFTPEQLEALKGPKGDTGEQGPAGETGPKGDDYVLTEQDKADIASLVLSHLPIAEEVSF